LRHLDQGVERQQCAFALAPAAAAAMHEQPLADHPLAHIAAPATTIERSDVDTAYRERYGCAT
jgi:hypothetical protein